MGPCILVLIISYSFLYGYYIQRTKCNAVAGSQNILIFAPHPDDGVIMAAGYAMQTRKNGGEVKVAYLSGNHQRLKEALNAWKIIGLAENDLIRLKIDRKDRLLKEEIDEKIKYLRMVIEDMRPQIIFMPLYEGGHFEHDLTNYLVSRAAVSIGDRITIYECPEYNYYFSIKNTPEKFLDIFSQLLPFFRFHAPPSFINQDNTQYLCMTDEEIEIKKSMLSNFVSQHPDDLIRYFGFNDRFQAYKTHDYYLPPHNYGNGIVYQVRYSQSAVIRKLFHWVFSRPFWQLDTIYSEEERRPLSNLLSK